MKEKFAFSAGRSAPQTFKDNYFDYNFAKFLGLETAHRIIDGDVDSWTSTWLGTARRVEALADKALEGGHKISAREAYLRATTYYQASFFFILDKDPLKAEV
jgi:hypothetical protein